MAMFDNAVFDHVIFDTGHGGGVSSVGASVGVSGDATLQRRRRRRNRHHSTLSPNLVEALRRYLELRLAS